MSQLDGLRTVAVLLVFWQHWMPRTYTRGISWGAYGVDLFFVLSGFLITSILLRCKGWIEEGGQTAGFTAKRFYARRFLRIFPLYYAVLLVVTPFVALDAETRVSLWTYTYNLLAGFRGELHGRIAHFWSLAVEEQFYLFWPWVVLLVPRRRLLAVVVACVLVGPLTRIGLLVAGQPADALRAFTLSCFDTLVGGALLAVLCERYGLERVATGRWMKPLLVGSLAWTALLLSLQLDRRPDELPGAWAMLAVSTKAPLFCWLVVSAAHGFRGPLGRFLAWRPMTWLGQISYGLYVFHAFPFLLMRFEAVRSVPPLERFLLFTTLTVALAWLSWRFFEAPINRRKDRYPYRDRAAAASPEGGRRAA